MSKTYTNKEIKELLRSEFDAIEISQDENSYDDEFIVSAYDEYGRESTGVVEVVNTLTAIKNENDFSDDNDFLIDTIEHLINGALEEIGAYTKLAENLYWRAL